MQSLQAATWPTSHGGSSGAHGLRRASRSGPLGHFLSTACKLQFKSWNPSQITLANHGICQLKTRSRIFKKSILSGWGLSSIILIKILERFQNPGGSGAFPTSRLGQNLVACSAGCEVSWDWPQNRPVAMVEASAQLYFQRRNGGGLRNLMYKIRWSTGF